MDALIGQILGDVRGIAEDVLRREGVRVRTATVAGTDPTRIVYDGETDPSVVTPRRTVRVATGDRVVVAKSRGQATIIGVLTKDLLSWERVTLESGLTYPGHGYYLSVQRDGVRRWLRGRVGRTGGATMTAGGGITIGTLDARDRPTQAAGGIGQVSSFTAPGYARAEINPSGTLIVAPSKDTDWIGLDSITWDVT